MRIIITIITFYGKATFAYHTKKEKHLNQQPRVIKSEHLLPFQKLIDRMKTNEMPTKLLPLFRFKPFKLN